LKIVLGNENIKSGGPRQKWNDEKAEIDERTCDDQEFYNTPPFVNRTQGRLARCANK
jgi:hypothetical protein